MNLKVGIIDYGMGNLHSVAKAVALQGGRVSVSSNKAELRGSDLLVLPGVGAFGAAMKNLAKSGLDDFAVRWIEEGRPYLGICLGFQLLFERSDESRGSRGLGVFKGNVSMFRGKEFAPGKLQVPHMGWNSVAIKNSEAAVRFKGVESDLFYFVHSFFPEPEDASLVGTMTSYGKPFCSSISTSNVFASQFHPEKSGTAGLKLLKKILKRAERSAERIAA